MAFSKERSQPGEKTIETLYPLHEIDSFNGEELKNYIYTVADDIDGILINFSRITYLNSSGLRELIQVLKYLKEKNKALFLTKINPDIKKIFVHTNLHKLFRITETDEEALQSL